MAQKPTLDKLIQDLELVKQMAIDDRHITGAISAIVTQAKLLGLDKGVTDDDATAKPVTIEFVAVDCKRYTDADIDRQADGSFYQTSQSEFTKCKPLATYWTKSNRQGNLPLSNRNLQRCYRQVWQRLSYLDSIKAIH